MAVPRARSFLASVLGWVIVAIIAYFVLGALVGTILWILRTLLIIVAIGGLIWLYFRLKTPKD
ncbi:MAG: hypothetical protein JWL72_3241 [Ilumatobacteraceae bacterium]|nr:hypothetical protein [Ilumatobacteraceae bacterium]MCU1396871.1 hypothetical protein [Ilumatobacteraceae bacterium]